ncbi:MAG: thioredoxin-dependent thiol peroxidase [Prolixibacteraceae bacterium]
MEQLIEGAVAPPFEGTTQDGRILSLSDFKGKKLILYFYPKDNTPGCTAESCNLSENYDFWLSKGIDVVGVSPDSSSSHLKFIEKYGLRFNLIADTEKKILQDYGVWGEKMNYGKSYMGVIRTTFLINENGIVEKIFKKVDTKNHTDQIAQEINIK